MLKTVLLVFSICCWASILATNAINSHITDSDNERYQQIFRDSLNNDIQAIYYGATNAQELSAELKKTTCTKAQAAYKESKLNDFEKNFYLVEISKALSCQFGVNNEIQANLNLQTKEFVSSQEMYFNFFTAKSLGLPIDDALKSKLSKQLQVILKKDDSLSSLGYGFHVAAEFNVHGQPIADWIEAAIAQADEVDGKMLQFEGGLSVTALVINGAFKLTTSLNKPAPLTADQIYKFATYFLSRRSVQSVKGVAVLLEVLRTITAQTTIAPICIQLIGNNQIPSDAPVVNVKIVNILARPVSPAITATTINLIGKPGNTVLLTKAPLVSRSSDKTIYSIDLSTAKLIRGKYILEVNADAYKQSININVIGRVKVQQFEIGIGDSDSTAATVKKQSIVYPEKLSQNLHADSQQKIIFKATLIDEASGQPLVVHQAFVRLENQQTKEEIIFVAEQDTTKVYKFDMDVGARGGDFGYKSGVYSLEFIVGDASLSNSFKWHIADVTLKFSGEAKVSSKTLPLRIRPEIIHQFRQPEVRPPRMVSDLFSILCIIPIVVLFILWAKLGVNVGNFPFNLSALGFHLGLGAILSLFGLFFWQLNMFDTLRYLMPLALFTFICGNRLLRTIANRRQAEVK